MQVTVNNSQSNNLLNVNFVAKSLLCLNQRNHLYINLGEDDLTPEGDGVGNAGSRIACGLILEPSDEGMGITILIIILVVVAILVVALLICICCYYCKRYSECDI